MERTDWTEAVLAAIHRLTVAHHTYMFSRQKLIQEELPRIVTITHSTGATPEQTLSRILQELRDARKIEFFEGERGRYLLLDEPIAVEQEDLPENALTLAVERNRLRFRDVQVGESVVQVRQREGQKQVRAFTLNQYGYQCALCDVNDDHLLVASHIDRWTDNWQGRGDLRNVICMCRFDDALFEYGYISLTDDYRILKKSGLGGMTMSTLLNRLEHFRTPSHYPPGPGYLRQHRTRTGFPV